MYNINAENHGNQTSNLGVERTRSSVVPARLAQWCLQLAAAPAAHMTRAEQLALMVVEDEWKNALVLGPLLPPHTRARMPHLVQTWLRCWLGCAALYFACSAAWCAATWGSVLLRRRRVRGPGSAGASDATGGVAAVAPGQLQELPGWGDVMEQIWVSLLSMPLYALLPTATEALAEAGWTAAYPRIAGVGLPGYVALFFAYMGCVEAGVYWAHRLLHDFRLGYRYLHRTHHVYNQQHTLSPLAGLAFNPIDGILQALPYTLVLLVVPMHYFTYELLMFATVVWTTNIHDCVHGRVWPIMGAGYHTIHHTTYRHNYGHYTVFMDWLMGTLLTPEQHQQQRAAKRR